MQIDTGPHLPDPAPAPGTRIGIIAARFNGDVTTEMLGGCRSALEEFGVEADAIDVYWVPGAWELPQAARRIAALDRHDAFIDSRGPLEGLLVVEAATTSAGPSQFAASSGCCTSIM